MDKSIFITGKSELKNEYITAPEIYSAFRGRPMSLLVLTHSGVSSRPLLPQESPYISSAKVVYRSSLELIDLVLSKTPRTI